MRIILINKIPNAMKMPHNAILALLLCGSILAALSPAQAEEVNLYSARQQALIQPLLDAFTADTGIKVNVISSKADALLKRIESESINSPADVLLTTDAGRLHRAKVAGVLTPLDSKVLQDNIPSQYRDEENTWFGLSVRVRPIMVTEKADKSKIERYEDLADPAFKNQICVRSSSNIYNQSLVASFIESQGKETTETWAQGLVENFARKPQGGDRDQIKAAAAGQCSIVIANTYYLATMLAGDAESLEYKAARAMTIIWPNQSDRGAHANVSGAGVVKWAPNKDNAIKLIEYLSSDTAQQLYADVNFEYPVKPSIKINPILTQWGNFKADSISLSKLGTNNATAVRLMDRVGWK